MIFLLKYCIYISFELLFVTDKICILALKLLPYLFKKIVKQTIKSSTHKNWSPEKEEVEKSFIVHIHVRII